MDIKDYYALMVYVRKVIHIYLGMIFIRGMIDEIRKPYR